MYHNKHKGTTFQTSSLLLLEKEISPFLLLPNRLFKQDNNSNTKLGITQETKQVENRRPHFSSHHKMQESMSYIFSMALAHKELIHND